MQCITELLAPSQCGRNSWQLKMIFGCQQVSTTAGGLDTCQICVRPAPVLAQEGVVHHLPQKHAICAILDLSHILHVSKQFMQVLCSDLVEHMLALCIMRISSNCL